VRHAIGAARAQPGLEQLVLTVTDSNMAARRLYERAGFRSCGVEPRAIRVGDAYFDKNHMVLFLTRP
jgi:RimJ/RimL family protein N-acetyltransferase